MAVILLEFLLLLFESKLGCKLALLSDFGPIDVEDDGNRNHDGGDAAKESTSPIDSQ